VLNKTLGVWQPTQRFPHRAHEFVIFIFEALEIVFTHNFPYNINSDLCRLFLHSEHFPSASMFIENIDELDSTVDNNRYLLQSAEASHLSLRIFT